MTEKYCKYVTWTHSDDYSYHVTVLDTQLCVSLILQLDTDQPFQHEKVHFLTSLNSSCSEIPVLQHCDDICVMCWTIQSTSQDKI